MMLYHYFDAILTISTKKYQYKSITAQIAEAIIFTIVRFAYWILTVDHQLVHRELVCLCAYAARLYTLVNALMPFHNRVPSV